MNNLEGPISHLPLPTTNLEKGKQKDSVSHENFLASFTFADLSPETSPKDFQNAKAKQIDGSLIQKLDKNLFEQAGQIEKK